MQQPSGENIWSTALGPLLRFRLVLAVLTGVSLLVGIGAFALVEFCRYFEGDASRVGTTLGPPDTWAGVLQVAVAWARVVLTVAPVGMAVTGVATLLVALVGCLPAGVIRHASAAAVSAIAFALLCLPWRVLPLELGGGTQYSAGSFGPVAEFGLPAGPGIGAPDLPGASFGTAWSDPGSMWGKRLQMRELRLSAGGSGTDAPSTGRLLAAEAGYFGRMVAYPAAMLLWLLVAAWRVRLLRRSVRQAFV